MKVKKTEAQQLPLRPARNGKPRSAGAKVAGGFTFIDLFAGIGGLRLGFESIGGRCLFTSEWNKYAQVTYRENFKDEHKIAGDIRAVKPEEIPEHDVLLAGFPCQPFSIAGVSKKNALGRPHGFACKTQGTLFFEVAKILDSHRPKAFLLENVKNLVRHDAGRTFKTIRETLEEDLGYHVTAKVIDAKGYVPQHRERIFIVGFKDDAEFTLADFVPAPPDKGPRLRAVLHGEDCKEVEEPYTDATGNPSARYTLTEHLWAYLQRYAEKHKLAGHGFGFGLFGPDDVARTLSARYHKDGSEILIRRGDEQDDVTPRRLTPRECARLMGFDAPGRRFKIPVSDTQAYRQFGNAVVVPVIADIARFMAPALEAALAPPARKRAAQ